MSTNVCGHFIMAQLPVLISLGIVVSCPTKTILIVYPPAPTPQIHSNKKSTVWSLKCLQFSFFVSIIFYDIFYFSFFSPAVKVEELQGIPTSL